MKPLTVIDPSKCSPGELWALERAGYATLEALIANGDLPAALEYQVFRTEQAAKQARVEHPGDGDIH